MYLVPMSLLTNFNTLRASTFSKPRTPPEEMKVAISPLLSIYKSPSPRYVFTFEFGMISFVYIIKVKEIVTFVVKLSSKHSGKHIKRDKNTCSSFCGEYSLVFASKPSFSNIVRYKNVKNQLVAAD